jgi:hypothetical protein
MLILLDHNFIFLSDISLFIDYIQSFFIPLRSTERMIWRYSSDRQANINIDNDQGCAEIIRIRVFFIEERRQDDHEVIITTADIIEKSHCLKMNYKKDC